MPPSEKSEKLSGNNTPIETVPDAFLRQRVHLEEVVRHYGINGAENFAHFLRDRGEEFATVVERLILPGAGYDTTSRQLEELTDVILAEPSRGIRPNALITSRNEIEQPSDLRDGLRGDLTPAGTITAFKGKATFVLGGRGTIYYVQLRDVSEVTQGVLTLRRDVVDYITTKVPTFDTPRLLRLLSERYAQALRVAQDNESLQKESWYDPMTDVLNRRGLEKTYDIFRTKIDEGKYVALYMLDSDHFKLINETYTHLGGDAVIKEMARRLVATVRQPAQIIRFGGDEFGILTAVSSVDEAQRLGERVRTEMSSRPCQYQGRTISFTISVGYSVDEGGNLDLNELYGQADQSELVAKHGLLPLINGRADALDNPGRNQVIGYQTRSNWVEKEIKIERK
ncbi:GGDEF domain-containing protein [Candidatus Woesearchaeota archaeon]|nr:GGDEF domain-containing protein [Candidatus Woesearchaeota archaeon]